MKYLPIKQMVRATRMAKSGAVYVNYFNREVARRDYPTSRWLAHHYHKALTRASRIGIAI